MGRRILMGLELLLRERKEMIRCCWRRGGNWWGFEGGGGGKESKEKMEASKEIMLF